MSRGLLIAQQQELILETSQQICALAAFRFVDVVLIGSNAEWKCVVVPSKESAQN